MTLQGKFDCYRKHKVDIKHYGKEECDYAYNPDGGTDGNLPPYLSCMIKNKVPYDYKQACLWINEGYSE